MSTFKKWDRLEKINVLGIGSLDQWETGCGLRWTQKPIRSSRDLLFYHLSASIRCWVSLRKRRATNLCWGSFFLIFKWLPHLANISRAEEPRSKRWQCDKQPSAIQIPINCICRFFCFNRGRVKLFYLAPLLAWQLGCKKLESTKPLPDKMAEIRI